MKKSMILTVLVVVMALPAAASANWKDHTTNLTANANITIAGPWSFTGGVSCPEVTYGATFEPGTTGQITSYTIDGTAKCAVTGTLAALGCKEVVADQGTNLPWIIHDDEATKITVTNLKIDHTVKGTGSCAGGITAVFEGNMTMTPVGGTATISKLNLSGKLKSNLGTEPEIGGEPSVIPGATYSL